MAGDDSVSFNHVGLCVRDLDASRRFYESALGFTVVRTLSVPDAAAGQLLQLSGPMGLSAVYLSLGGFVLELLAYSARDVSQRARVMDEVGLTHMSLSVADLGAAMARVEASGGSVLHDTLIDGIAVFVRDPDRQLIELLAR